MLKQTQFLFARMLVVGADIQPVHVRDSERYGGALPALRAQDVPGPPPPGEVRAELSRQQEGQPGSETGL